MKITEKDVELMEEIIKDPIALEMLKNKCRWERMGRYAVLQEWGDPRGWSGYKKANQGGSK